MSNQLRQLLNQLSKTPSIKIKSTDNTTPTPTINLKRKRTTDTIDSGVDTILSNNNYTLSENIACNCKQCISRNKKRSELESTLKHAFVNYLRDPSEQKFANIPVIVVKSFKPTANRKQLDQVEVHKNNAVNALFMKDNKWVYVKTSENVKGFVPKKILEPFSLKSCGNNKSKNTTSSPILPKAPDSAPPPISQLSQKNLFDHTYMTINEADFKADFHEDMMMESDETDLALLSVSNYIDSPKKPRLPKNLMKRFIECDLSRGQSPCNSPKLSSKSTQEIISVLAKSKSRNRKISIAFRQLSNEATLTMLEGNDCTRNYINLNDCNNFNYENSERFSPIIEESFATVSNKKRATNSYLIDYENLPTYKSNNYNSSSSSHSSIDYDVISSSDYNNSIQVTPSNSQGNYYLNDNNSPMLNDEDHVYDHLSSNNSKVLNIYRVIESYRADFKGDLTVRKGDIVSLIDSMSSPNKNNDYLFVRIHKRNLKLTPGKFFSNQVEQNNVQGYIPRSHVAKI